MKYILDNKSDSIKSVTKNPHEALEIKYKADNNNSLKAEKILIVDTQLKKNYIQKKLNKKVIEILAKMQFILENSDDSEGNIAIVLDEIERLKGILINKYQKHLEAAEYKAFFKKILLIEEDFKNKYNAIQIYKEMLMEEFQEKRGR